MLLQMAEFLFFIGWVVFIYIYIYYIFLIHLGCFYILTIVNNTTMNIEVHIAFELVF